MSHLSEAELTRIAHLARLSLSPDEARAMAAELDTILGYVEMLQGVETEGVPPTSHVLPLATPFRADEPRPSLSPERAVGNAPAAEGSAFAVPDVIEGEDEEG
jgi:aspartyl-tRNA(Asn)/glutamyl-tRNA(Gln) amidotransferase subunit C